MLQVFHVVLHVFSVTLQETRATLQLTSATLQETRPRPRPRPRLPNRPYTKPITSQMWPGGGKGEN